MLRLNTATLSLASLIHRFISTARVLFMMTTSGALLYAGVALLSRAFPDVTVVSESVLEAFRLLPPGMAIREIDHFVKRFDQVQYGEVTLKNLPTCWECDRDLWQYDEGSTGEKPRRQMRRRNLENWIASRQNLDKRKVKIRS